MKENQEEKMTEYNSEAYLKKLDKWWRAATYLGAGMIFLKENPLFSVTGTPIKAENLKANPIGHWGTRFQDKLSSMLMLIV